MSCGCTDLGSYAKCAGFPIFLTDVEGPKGEWAAHYAQVVGAPFGKDDSEHCSPWNLCVNVVLCHRFPYYKKSPHDCGSDTKVDISGALGGKITGLTGAAAGLTSGAIGLATGVEGISAGLETGGLAAVGAIAGIAAFGAGLIAIPFAIIAHHSQAVALEESVLCQVSSGYNSFAEQVETALKNGAISLDQANNLADQMQAAIIQGLSNGYNNCNARCYYTYAIKAITLFCKERYYPSLVPKNQVSQTVAASGVSPSGTATAAGVAAVAYGLASSHPLIALGGLVVSLVGIATKK